MMQATKGQAKVHLLQNLIQHPRTGQQERDAAFRALQRVLAAVQKDGTQVSSTGVIDGRHYGPKYHTVRDMTLPEIAKLMRQDIKLARKIGRQTTVPGEVATIDPIGTMPDQIKISVRSEYYSGGGSIHIRVKNIPFEWGFLRDPTCDARFGPSPALGKLLAELRTIHGAYNYDGSDIYTDYFDKNYFGGVQYDYPEEHR